MADDLQQAELFVRWEEDSGKSFLAWWEGQELWGGLSPSLYALPALVARYSALYQALGASHHCAQTSVQVVWLLGGRSLQMQPSRFATLLAQARPERRSFYLVLDALTSLQVVARASGTQILVVIQPSKEMTYFFSHDEATPAPNHAVRQALAQRARASIALTPLFRQWASTGEPLFCTANRSPNAQGRTLIAQEVLRHLTATAQTSGVTPEGQRQDLQRRDGLHRGRVGAPHNEVWTSAAGGRSSRDGGRPYATAA